MWLKAKNSRQLTTSIENLIEGSEYRFRVRAENPYGISDPSEESEIIFIPDSKRGSHQPSLTMNASSILKESKRPIEKDDREDTEESKKRRLLEEKAKKLLDTPMSELLPYENAKPEKRKAESSPETTFFDIGTESIPPSVPRRKNQKEKRINLNSTNNLEQNPMLINSQRKSSTDKISDEKTSNCELNVQNLNILETVDGKEVDKTLNSQHANDKHLVNEKETFSFESPLYPRETDDNIIHGSSEIMLVIYPPERSKSLELSEQNIFFAKQIKLKMK